MTLDVKIAKGPRYTLWNVTGLIMTPDGVRAEHSDRPNSRIQGFIESIKRRDSEPTTAGVQS